MNRSIRLFALVALASAVAACNQAAGSIGDVPTTSPTAAASPTPSEIDSATRCASPVGKPDSEFRGDAFAD